MKSKTTQFLLLSVFVIISACASLTKEECLSSDWQVIGETDGERGYDPQRQFQRHVVACERVNVMPDHTLWYQGYQQGLRRYCTPVKGLIVGQKGSSYNNVCPPETERGFLRGYLLGKKENSIRSRIGYIEISITGLDSDIDSLLDKLAGASPPDIPKLRGEIRQKRFELESLRNEKEQEIYRFSQVESLIERFLENPQMVYDTSSL